MAHTINALSSPGQPREPLGRAFHVHFSAVSLANLADGILMVGIPLIAVSLTRSPQEVALLQALFWLPSLLFSLLAGLVIDRTDRRRVRIAALGLRAILLAGLLLLHLFVGLSIWVLIGFMGLYGLTQVFVDLAGRSMVPQLVPTSRLDAANGRTLAAERVFHSFIGGPVAGVLVLIGAAWLVSIPTAACVAAGALLVLELRGSFRPQDPGHSSPSQSAPSSQPSPLRGVFHGLRLLWDHPMLRPVVIMACAANLASTAYGAVFILWVVGTESAVGLTEAQYPLLMVATTVGAVAASVTVERLQRWVPGVSLMLWGWLLQAPLLVVPLVLPHFGALVASMALIGFLNMTGNTLSESLLQRMVPAHLLGRVIGSVSTVGFGLMPVGAVLGGAVAERLGLPVVFIGAASLLALAVVYPMARINQTMVDARAVTPATRR